MSLTLAACDAVAAPGTWTVDTARSRVRFSVSHIMVATVTGDFTDFEGTLEVTPAGVATAAGQIRAASIDTDEPKRDERLRSADFFDVERHPAIGFVSTAIECAEGSRLRITGRLTIRDVTQDIALEGRVRPADHDAPGGERLTLELRGTLSHRAFGIGTAALAANRVILGHKAKIAAELSVVRAKATKEAA